MNNDRVLNMRISADLYERLREYAEKKGISLASAVRIACSELLEKEDKQK